MTWNIKKNGKTNFKNSILIEGLPGIGNVGKIAADLLLQELKNENVAEFFSYTLPNSVFIQEDNLVELPKLEIKHVKHDKQDFLFLVGDVQPTEEVTSYEFTEKILDYAEQQGCTEIITLGGIGLQEEPKTPKVYCTSNNENLLKELSKQGANPKIYGKVGPLMGVSGLLLGMGKKRKIKAGALLAETLAHPMYVGLKGSRELLKVLKKRYGFNVSMTDLDKEIKDIEDQIRQNMQAHGMGKDTSYIG